MSRFPGTNGDAFPKWFVRFIVTTSILMLSSLVGGAVGVAWWGATISSKLENLESTMNRSVEDNAERIETLQGDFNRFKDNEFNIMQTKVNLLREDYKVMLDRYQRSER